jgi:CRP/FNR family transcriptional regulator, polysaccharide utilization system transcription regulator
MDNTLCLIPDYGALTSEQIRIINESSFVVSHKKNEPIFKQDKPASHFMFARKGLVKLFKELPNNKSLILKLSRPDEYLGMTSLFYDNRYQYSATALDDTEIIYTSIQVLRDVIKQNGEYALFLMHQISAETIYMIGRTEWFSHKQVPGRIAESLLFFSRKVYKSDHFTLPISRQELADLVSSTKENVSRTLTEFKNDRMIEIDDKVVELKSIELLEILSKIG